MTVFLQRRNRFSKEVYVSFSKETGEFLLTVPASKSECSKE
jgi:hypothetical protein